MAVAHPVMEQSRFGQIRLGAHSRFTGVPTVYPASSSDWTTRSSSVRSSSNVTEIVCRSMSASAWLTPSTFSTAARAFAAVPPQTTPGVGST